MITNYFNKTVDTERLGNVGGGSLRTSFSAKLTSISVAIHPLNPAQVLVAGSSFYNTFKMFCASTHDILIGDRIIDGSTKYTVQSVADFDDVSSDNTHQEVIIVKGE